MGDPVKRMNSPRYQRSVTRHAMGEAASSGCLMALVMLPFTALWALLRRK